MSYDTSDLERRRRRRGLAALAAFCAVLALVAFLEQSSAAGAPSGADGPDTTVTAAPAVVFGPAASLVPRGDAALSFVSLALPPPEVSPSGLAAGREAGRQVAVQPSSRGRGSVGAADGSAPVGTFGLALEVEPWAGAADEEAVAPDLPPVAAAIAACESGQIDADGRPVLGTYSLTAQNPTSSASGKFQFIDATWRETTGLEPPASAYPEDVQDQAFVDLWDEGRGASRWAASAWCWAGAA